MEGLGRIFNIIPIADAVTVHLRDYDAVTFICVNADTYTVQDANTQGGGAAANLAVIDNYYTNAQLNGTAAWARVNQAAAASFTIAGGAAAFTVDAASLRDGFRYVRCSSTAAGLVYAIVHDLHIARAIQNLPALSA